MHYDSWKLKEPAYLKVLPPVSQLKCEECGKSSWQFVDTTEVDGFEYCEFQCLAEIRDAKGEWICGHTMKVRA